MIVELATLLTATLRMATPLIYTGIGETYSERAGVINIGLEGLMLIGAFSAYATAVYTQNLFLSVLAAMFFSALFGLAFAYLAVTLKTNQIIIGAALNMVGLGVTGFFYRTLFAQTGMVKPIVIFSPIPIPGLSSIPFIGPILFNQNMLVYGMFLLIPLAAFILFKTPFGLAVRSLGEHPLSADSVGINVSKLRYITVLISAALAGVGGAYLSVAHANQFIEGMTSGRGFIALAIVAFGRWKPVGVLWAGLIFGAAFALQLRLQVAHLNISYQFLQILPYVITILVLIIARGKSAQPKELGVPYPQEQ